MEDIDTNKDGFVDFDEFRQHMHGLLKKGEYSLRKNLQSLGSQEKKKDENDSSEENSDCDSSDD